MIFISGNLIAICSSGIIHYIYSKFIDPQDFDFATLDSKLRLVEQDLSGLGAEQKDKTELRKTKKWIKSRGYLLTFVLAILWPVLSIPAEIFTRDFFAFWVLISVAWGFGAAIVITFLPLFESQDEIISVLNGMYNAATGKKSTEDEEEIPIKSARKGTMTGSDEDPSERHNGMEDVKEKDVDAVSTSSSTADYNKFLSVVNDNKASDMA